MKASDLFVKCLEEEGIEYIFGVPGEENADFMMSLEKSDKITFILTRHEQGAACMALGAAQVTARPAALCVVPGPGMLNAAAGLTSAYWGNARVLALVGAVPSGLRGRSTGILHDLPDPAAVLRQPEFVTKLADRDAQPRRRDGRWVVAAAAGRGRGLTAVQPQP